MSRGNDFIDNLPFHRFVHFQRIFIIIISVSQANQKTSKDNCVGVITIVRYLSPFTFLQPHSLLKLMGLAFQQRYHAFLGQAHDYYQDV